MLNFAARVAVLATAMVVANVVLDKYREHLANQANKPK